MAKASDETISGPGVLTPRAIATALTAAAAVTAIGAFATLFSVWAGSGMPEPAKRLQIATEEYAAGRPGIAAKIAESVDVSADEQPDAFRLRQFLVGAGRARAAALMEDDDQHQQRLAMIEAAEVLEESERLGFPDGREREGYRLLGQALEKVGRYQQAAKHLEKAVAMSPGQRRELLPKLIVAQLQATDASPAKALHSADQFLAIENLSHQQKMNGRLLRGRALQAMKRWTAAREEFRGVAKDAQSPQIRDQALLGEAAAHVSEAIALQQQDGTGERVPAHVRAIAEEALQTLHEFERTGGLKTAMEARLWAARAHRCIHELVPALDRLAMVRLTQPFAAESIAAGLEEFEILASQQRETEAAQTIRYLIRETGDPRTFDGRLVSIDQFRKRVAAAVDVFRAAGKFDAAIDIARNLPPVMPLDEALVLEAAAFNDWARKTERQSKEDELKKQPNLTVDTRNRFQAAGDAYAAAAKLRFVSEQYTPTLWSAIEAYQNGREFARSLELLEDYLRFEERSRLPQGLVAQGRARLALGNAKESIPPLMECIEEYPRDSLRYEARLIVASAQAELGQLEKAKQLLNANVYDGQLSPRSPVWRDSLKLLADLLYREGYEAYSRLTEKVIDAADPQIAPDRVKAFRTNQEVLEDAIGRLEESAIREQILVDEGVLSDGQSRREAMRRSRSARYLAAQAHRMAAFWPGVEAQLPDVLDATQRLLHRQRVDHLEAAASGFATMQKALTREEEKRTLSEQENAMLRNSYLAKADVLRENRKWEEAAEAYRGVSLRYMNAPISLESMLGQSRCMRQQGRPREAKLILRQAQKVLNRIPASWDDQFVKTTRYSRDEWEELLDWLSTSGETMVAQDDRAIETN